MLQLLALLPTSSSSRHPGLGSDKERHQRAHKLCQLILHMIIQASSTAPLPFVCVSARPCMHPRVILLVSPNTVTCNFGKHGCILLCPQTTKTMNSMGPPDSDNTSKQYSTRFFVSGCMNVTNRRVRMNSITYGILNDQSTGNTSVVMHTCCAVKFSSR